MTWLTFGLGVVALALFYGTVYLLASAKSREKAPSGVDKAWKKWGDNAAALLVIAASIFILNWLFSRSTTKWWVLFNSGAFWPVMVALLFSCFGFAVTKKPAARAFATVTLLSALIVVLHISFFTDKVWIEASKWATFKVPPGMTVDVNTGEGNGFTHMVNNDPRTIGRSDQSVGRHVDFGNIRLFSIKPDADCVAEISFTKTRNE
jgi:hypothetical protein